jgi:hypothetical protein
MMAVREVCHVVAKLRVYACVWRNAHFIDVPSMCAVNFTYLRSIGR